MRAKQIIAWGNEAGGQHKIEGVNIQGQLCKVAFQREGDEEFTKCVKGFHQTLALEKWS